MQSKFAADLLPRMSLEGDERVLDIGCGDGKISAAIARRLPRGSIVGVDISHAMVHFAQQTYPPSSYRNLSFKHADASRLDYCRDFDWVVSFAALHWVIEHPPVLTGIARALTARGRVLLQFGGQGNGGPLFALASDVIHASAWRTYFVDFQFPWRFYAASEYEPMVCHAGLVPDRVAVVLREAAHEGRNAFTGWMRSTWLPYLQRLPAEMWDAFIADVAERYLALCPADADGIVRVPMMRIEVEAHKP
jgi:trans-aconitate 2-methyltransferase